MNMISDRYVISIKYFVKKKKIVPLMMFPFFKLLVWGTMEVLVDNEQSIKVYMKYPQLLIEMICSG